MTRPANMPTANGKGNIGDTTVAFRIPVTRRRLLEAIGVERGHENLTVTMRDCVDQYIDAYLRRDVPEAA